MKILLDDIEWSVPEGTDITGLPVLEVIDVDLKGINEQDEFWDLLYSHMSTKYNTELWGCSYNILDGTIH